MTRPPKPASRPAPTREAAGIPPVGLMALAWLVPGGAHLAMGQARRGGVLLAVLSLMFILGLGFGGRLFPFQFADPLVFLAAIAEWALGAPRLFGAVAGLGSGDVVAATYEYGNTFLIAAGLLNLLAMLDAFDRAMGRK